MWFLAYSKFSFKYLNFTNLYHYIIYLNEKSICTYLPAQNSKAFLGIQNIKFHGPQSLIKNNEVCIRLFFSKGFQMLHSNTVGQELI